MAPRNTIAPGTWARIREKSSDPAIGCGMRTQAFAPNNSAATDIARSTASASLTVTGYSLWWSTSTLTPCAAAMPSHVRRATSAISAEVAGSTVRTVASKLATSGMMLRLVPAWNVPTVSTAGANASTDRDSAVCSASTISQAAGIGSAARCGDAACPPRPCTLTRNASLAAIIAPAREVTVPRGLWLLSTCSA